jgi:hypothetical protein
MGDNTCVDGYYFLLIVIAQQDASHSPKDIVGSFTWLLGYGRQHWFVGTAEETLA